MTAYRLFLSQYLKAYCHQGGIKALALGEISPEWFSEIQREVSWILLGQNSSDVADKNHTTNWTRPRGEARQFSLYNATGKSDEYLSDFAPSLKVAKKLAFPQLKAIARFAGLFGSELVNLRLNGLGASSGLSLHEESPIGVTPFGRTYRARFHLPIFTNPRAHMLLDGEQFHFGAGRLYFFHHGSVHAAVNNADTKRYHFVLDCEMTSDLFAKIFPSAEANLIDGYCRFSDTESKRLSKGEPIPFGEFITEEGKKITEIDYGRRVPTALDWYRLKYPSILDPIDRLLGRTEHAQ